MASRQEWYTTGDDNDGDNFEGGGATASGYTDAGQTFTLGMTGNNLTFTLTDIDMLINKTLTPADSTIELYETDPAGKPKGSTISTGTLLTADISSTMGWINVTMSAVTLKANTQYALVFSAGLGDAANFFRWRMDATGPTYAGGTSLVTDNSMATWTTQAAYDRMFQINGGSYKGTLCSLSDAVNKAGTNASSGGTEEVLVSDFVKQAEGVINSVTRRNWIPDYPTLSDAVKFILNEVTSNLAAIYIITYDMSNYSSRVEAESMINVYREAVNRALFILIDKQTQTFIDSLT